LIIIWRYPYYESNPQLLQASISQNLNIEHRRKKIEKVSINNKQTQIISQMNWDSETFNQIFKNKCTSKQTQMNSQMNWDSESFIQNPRNKWTRWTKWTNTNSSSNELRYRKLYWNPREQVNKLKELVKWIEIQRASYKTSRTIEQSEQTQIVGQMNWDPESFNQIFENKWTSKQTQIVKTYELRDLYLSQNGRKWTNFWNIALNMKNKSGNLTHSDPFKKLIDDYRVR
jgi:hypothetical protein